jgi:LacI family transcriptional regulator
MKRSKSETFRGQERKTMGATIRDIQKLTGLSLATISKYLNGGNVLPENRAAIGRAIEELHYEVNEVARGLKTRQTRIVGVLLHDLKNIFAGTIISRMEDILRQHGYGMFLCDCRGNPELEAEEIQFLLGKQVDGIITFPTSENSGYLKLARERGIPIVLIDRIFDDQEFDSVIVDNETASKLAVEKLLAYGHRRIGMICGDEHYYTARKRLYGFCRAMEVTGAEACIAKGELTVGHGYEAMKKMLDMKERPTAVFLSNYEITLGAVIAMNEQNVSFPKEISVIGFDNMMLAQVVKPKLWMITQPMEQIAVRAAEIMMERLKNGSSREPQVEILQTMLSEGESIGRIV